MANELLKLTSETTYAKIVKGEEGDILTQIAGGDVEMRPPKQVGSTSYNAESGTTAPPSSGKVRWNNASQTLATELFLSTTDSVGNDLSNLMASWKVGDDIYLQNQSDSSQFQTWDITSITDNTTYFTFGVSLQSNGGTDFSTIGQGQALTVVKETGGALINALEDEINTLGLSGSDLAKLKDTLSSTGWGLYSDSQYTEISPLNINNAKVQLPCDKLGSTTNESELPCGVTTLWNSTTNKIAPVNSGDAYALRVTFKCKALKDAFFDIQLDIGNPSGIVVSSETKIHPKENNIENRYSFDIPIFSLGTFIANGGTIFIDSTDNGADLNIYDINIFIARLHKAKGEDY